MKQEIYTGEDLDLVLSLYEDDGVTPIEVKPPIRVMICQGSTSFRCYQEPMPLEPTIIPNTMVISENRVLIHLGPEDTNKMEGPYDVQVMLCPDGKMRTIGVFHNAISVTYAKVGSDDCQIRD